MRHLVLFLLPVLASIALLAPAQEVRPVTRPDPPVEKQPDPAIARLRESVQPEFLEWSPDYVVERCAEFLATINEKDRYRIRLFSLADVPRQYLPAAIAGLYFGTNKVARVPFTQVPRPVPNTDNRIFWVDLCWFNWSYEAWEAASEEDPYFREPIVSSHNEGLKYLKEQTRANPVIRGDWFLWYTFDNTEFLKVGETFNEKAFYYRFLYANVEFERTVAENGKTVKKKVRGVGPANAHEFQQAWLVEFSHLKDFPTDMGFMVDKRRSGVSYENRIGWRVRGKNGNYWRTFDVLRSVGDQDFVETPFPKLFDAGEHIFQDVRGNQVYHLTNGADKSTDIGDPRIVRDHTSGARVLMTAGSCIHCHDTGIIPFKNEHLVLQDIGDQLMAYDKARADRFKQFYLQDRRMKLAVEEDQRNFTEFIKDCNGLTPQENATQFSRIRGWYMQDVTLKQAARELGAGIEEFSDAIGYQATKGRLGRLVLDGRAIPRYTWERGGFQEAGLLLIEWRKMTKMEQDKLKEGRRNY